MSEFSGHLSLRAEVGDGGRTGLTHQSFRAPFHLSKPYWDGHALIVQVVNPTAGILAGDRLASDIVVGQRAALLVTTPSSSRVFQMRSEECAESRQSFVVKPSGWLEFMPEPLVPHRGSRFRQVTEIAVADSGELFYGEILMPGRITRGETWAWDRLQLELSVHVGDELILRERLDQSGSEMRALAELAGQGTSACFANVVIVSPRLAIDGPWRSELVALHGAGVWAGLSELRGGKGGWSLKVIAADTIGLRRALKETRRILQPLLPRLASDPRKL